MVQLVEALGYKPKVTDSIVRGVTGIFRYHNFFGCTVTLGVISASDRNEYQEYFLRLKVAGTQGLQLTTFMRRLS